MVRARPRPALPDAHRARHRQASRSVSRIPDAARSTICIACRESIPTEHAVFIEPVAAACEILDQVRIPEGATAWRVLGDGKLGLLVAQVLQAHGARVHLFGRHREKMRIAEQAGVTTEVTPKKLPEAPYRWVVDATGSAEGLRAAVTMAQPRGTVIMKSTVHGLVTDRHRAGDRQRNHAGRLALRPIRAGDQAAQAPARFAWMR